MKFFSFLILLLIISPHLKGDNDGIISTIHENSISVIDLSGNPATLQHLYILVNEEALYIPLPMQDVYLKLTNEETVIKNPGDVPSKSPESPKPEKLDRNIPFPVMVTSIDGENRAEMILHTNTEDNGNTKSETNFDELIDEPEKLIPFFIDFTNNQTVRNQDTNGVILWYLPDENLINNLNEQTAEAINHEMKNFDPDVTETNLPCRLTETCRSKAPVERLRINPNPTSGKINVELQFKEKRAGKIEILTLRGQKRKALDDFDLNSGQGYNREFRLNDLPGGIYLVHVLTDKGESERRRILLEN